MASQWMCRLALALLGLGLSGCSGDTFVDCIPPPVPVPEAETAPGLVVTGRQVRMKVTPTADLSGCGTLKSILPSSATAEIEGPGGEQVESQITLVQSFRAPATLEFTPDRPGPHHIVVTFSQVGGLHQFDLHAAQDRSSELPSESVPMACDTLERTAKGAWVCGSSVLRGSTVVKSFSSAQLAVAGDVIWVVDGTSVHRYVDTGTDLVLSASLSHFRGGTEFLRASPDELLVLHNYSLGYYTFSAGLITAPPYVTWARPPNPIIPGGPYGVMLRDGARMGLATRLQTGSEPAVQMCTYSLVSGMFQGLKEPCPSVPGELIGFEPGVLWTRDLPAFNAQGRNTGLIRRWVWAEGQLREQGSLSLGPNATFFERPMRRWEAVPLVRNVTAGENIQPVTAVLTWSPQKQAILLEHLDGEMAGVSASPSFYWGWTSTGPVTSTKVRLRPPPE